MLRNNKGKVEIYPYHKALGIHPDLGTFIQQSDVNLNALLNTVLILIS